VSKPRKFSCYGIFKWDSVDGWCITYDYLFDNEADARDNCINAGERVAWLQGHILAERPKKKRKAKK